MKGVALVAAFTSFTSFTLFTPFTSFTPLRPQAPAQQTPPVFRTRVDLMQLDVTVLDKAGRPVRGLTKDDFVLLEDNQPQTIQGFTAIDVPERTEPGPAWDKRTTSDVTTNEIDNDRIFVLVLDDGLGVGCCTELAEVTSPRQHVLPPRQTPDPWAVRELRKTAERFIDMLGPNDLAAVVFTGATYKSNQGLTLDRAKLLKAVQAYPLNDGTLFLDPGRPPPGLGGQPVQPIPQCFAAKQIIRMIDSVVESLSTLPDRRKSVVYFGGSMPWGVAGGSCGTHWMWQDAIDHAQQGHVTINPVQTAGLKPEVLAQHFDERYRAVADTTGGHAVVNTNDFEPGMRQIFLENSSYYLIAYQPTRDAADGTFRRLTVTVNRPDVDVRTRRSYWAPREPKPDQPPPEPPPPPVEALAGILPKSELPLRATAAAFPIAGTPGVDVALAIGIRQPPLAGRTADDMELLVKAFDADREVATDTQAIPIVIPAARPEATESRYEALARFVLPKPGKYEVRVSVHSAISDTRGSVYLDVDVPDHRKEKVSLSGVVLNLLPGNGPAAPPRLLRELTPLVPTTERSFGASDLAAAFVRVYQGGTGTMTPVTVRAQIRDAKDSVVLDQSDTIAADRFDDSRSAAYQLRLPLATLTSGAYLLTIEAGAGRATARRDVQFAVK